jgi:hypothetical protein
MIKFVGGYWGVEYTESNKGDFVSLMDICGAANRQSDRVFDLPIKYKNELADLLNNSYLSKDQINWTGTTKSNGGK